MYYFRFNPLDNLFIFMILKTVLSFSCRMSDFKTMTFEFENPRERVIRFFIGANGVNINKVKDELRMVSVKLVFFSQFRFKIHSDNKWV